MKTILFLLCVFFLASPSWAQVSGPVVQSLGGNYVLVQCNSLQLQPDDRVSIRRAGDEVGAGVVMRNQGGVCSVRVDHGAAQRFDVVVLVGRAVANDSRGPDIPLQFCPSKPASAKVTVAPAPAPQVRPPQNKRDEFWSTHKATGRVLNLNTGEIYNQ